MGKMGAVEQSTGERPAFEVFAWGHGFVGARESLIEAQSLASGYEEARIITYEDGGFRVVAEFGRDSAARAGS